MPDQDMSPDQSNPAALQNPVAGELAHLRPTTPLELLDRIFSVVARKPFVFAGLACLYAAPLLLLGLVAVALKLDDARASQVLLLALLLQQWPAAAVVVAAFQSAVFPHKKLSLLLALRASLERLPYFILTRALALIVIISLASVPSALNMAEIGWYATPVAIWALFAAVYLLILWALLPIVVMVERRAFVRAMARSAELMRGVFKPGWIVGDTAFRRLVLMAAVPFALVICLEVVPECWSLASDRNLDTRFALLTLVLSFVVDLVFAMYAYVGLTLLYMECRMRREALDLQVRLLANGHLQAPDESFEDIDS